MGERILITGTSSGIGQAIAIACAAAGHDVVATMRDTARSEPLRAAARARSVRVDVEPLDVLDPEAGDRVRELVARYGTFHTLVNNAGIGVVGAFEEQSEEDLRAQFETNVFGLLAVTRAVLPSMRAAGRGRVLNVSSLAGRFAPPLLSVYAATKHAIEGLSAGLRWELEPFGIHVVAVAPGMINTPLFSTNFRRGSLRRADSVYAAFTEALEKRILGDSAKGLPPEAVAEVVTRLVTDPTPAPRVVVGTDAHVLSTLRRFLPDRVLASMVRRAFAVK